MVQWLILMVNLWANTSIHQYAIYRSYGNVNGSYPPGFLRMVVLPALSRAQYQDTRLSLDAEFLGGYITVVGIYMLNIHHDDDDDDDDDDFFTCLPPPETKTGTNM